MSTETLPWNSGGSFAPGLDFRDDGSWKPEPYTRKPSPRYSVDIPGARDSDWASEWMKQGCGCGGSCKGGCSSGGACCDSCAKGGGCRQGGQRPPTHSGLDPSQRVVSVEDKAADLNQFTSSATGVAKFNESMNATRDLTGELQDVCCCCVEDIDIPQVWDTVRRYGHKFYVHLTSSATTVIGEDDYYCDYGWHEQTVKGNPHYYMRAAQGYHKADPKAGYMVDDWADMQKVLNEHRRITNKGRKKKRKFKDVDLLRVINEMDKWCDPSAKRMTRKAFDPPSVSVLASVHRVLLIKIIGKSGGCEAPCKCTYDRITVLLRQELMVDSDKGTKVKELRMTKTKLRCDGKEEQVVTNKLLVPKSKKKSPAGEDK